MRVFALQPHPFKYSCRSYLVLGDHSTLDDVNTLVDVGIDGRVMAEIETLPTGVGKRGVERVVLPHNHFDHAGGLAAVVDRYHPEVCAFTAFAGVTRTLRPGEIIRLGNADFEVINITAHSHDSICLYAPREGAIFTGDTPMRILGRDGSYPEELIVLLKRLIGARITAIYPGHEGPIRERPGEMLENSLAVLTRAEDRIATAGGKQARHGINGP